MRYLTLVLVLLWPLAVFCQEEEPEDVCKEAGDYWSEALEECFLESEMDFDAFYLWEDIQIMEGQKAWLLHEQQDYSAAEKVVTLGNYNVRIARFEARRDSTTDEDLRATYQRQIDKLVRERDFYDGVDVTEHGPKISALSQLISKHREELDSLLN